MRIELSVKGNPKALKRHRTVKLKNGMRIRYDPSENDKLCFLDVVQQKAPETLYTGALSLKVRFYMPRPKSHYRTGKYAGILKDYAPIYHTGIPDKSNLVKFIEDAMEGIFFKNDSQIAVEYSEKIYDEVPRTVIVIEGLLEGLTTNGEVTGVKLKR